VREAGGIFRETLTRRQFMTERSCARFESEMRRRMKSKRHGRLCFYVPHDCQQTRRFGGSNFSQYHRFAWENRARAAREARRSDMLLKQPNENPAGESARQRERNEKEGQPAQPVIGQHSALPKDECAKGQAESRSGGRSADRRYPIFLDPGPASGRSVDRGRAAKLGAMEIFQYSPTGLRALENADHQNTIMFRPPKSHTVSSRLLIILVIVTFFAFQVVRFSFAAHDQRAFFVKRATGHARA